MKRTIELNQAIIETDDIQLQDTKSEYIKAQDTKTEEVKIQDTKPHDIKILKRGEV